MSPKKREVEKRKQQIQNGREVAVDDSNWMQSLTLSKNAEWI